jgi:hypothetical protein
MICEGMKLRQKMAHNTTNNKIAHGHQAPSRVFIEGFVCIVRR